jgi:excisionase family DNA binding protein
MGVFAFYMSAKMQLQDKLSLPSGEAPSLPRLAYSMREAAQVLGVSYVTVHRLLKRGHLRASSVLRTKVIPRVEMERFLRESLQDGGAQ